MRTAGSLNERAAVPPGEGAAVQGFVEPVEYRPCEQRRNGVAELGLYVSAVTDRIEVIQRDGHDLCGPPSPASPTGLRGRERPVPPD